MKILAIETSSPHGSVAVAENGEITAERIFTCERGRGAEVFAALAELREAWEQPDVIAVGIGPGSYNGLRVACALASSFNMATGAILRALPSPCLLPVNAPHYFVCGDARGGRAYRAEVRDRRLIGEISLIPHAEATAITEQALPVFRVGTLPGGELLPTSAPEASILARLAASLPDAPPSSIKPIYVKPPHITPPRQPLHV